MDNTAPVISRIPERWTVIETLTVYWADGTKTVTTTRKEGDLKSLGALIGPDACAIDRR